MNKLVLMLSCLAVIATGVVVTDGASASATVLRNPSLESDHNSDGVPDCWSRSGSGHNTFRYARARTAHSGRVAERLVVSRLRSGERRFMVRTSRLDCAPSVQARSAYALSTWYRLSGTASWVVYLHSTETGRWVRWYRSAPLRQSAGWATADFVTPRLPAWADRMSVGLALRSTGSLVVDDMSADTTVAVAARHTRKPKPTPSPVPTTAAPTTAAPTSPAPTTTSPTVTVSPAPTSTTATPAPTVTTSPPVTTSAPTPTPTETATATSGTGRRWYVSRTGNGADGTSWSTAWRDFSSIAWASIAPGDEVVVDGGATRCPSAYDFVDHANRRPGLACGMQYATALRPTRSGTASSPVTIRLSSEAGRNGTVALFGGRATALPYCNQQSYAPSGTAMSAGVVFPGTSYVVVDGGHRSGFMVYGAADGVDLSSDQTHHITLRNMEIFDNGSYSTWANGYRTDNEGISLAGHDITIERTLVHDNGQDEIQDRYTGPVNGDSHAALSNIVLRDSWLYNRRDHPLYPGYSFNSGAQDIDAQDCTHVDGVQVWGGGLRQQGFTVSHVVFGPLLAQGFYPGDWDNASFDGVRLTDSLFINAISHNIIGDQITGSTTTPGGWLIDGVTSYQTGRPAPGMGSHGAVDLAGGGHTVTNSVFSNGYFYKSSAFSTATGNVWYGGDPVPGGVQAAPTFVGPLPSTDAPTFAQLYAADFTPRCTACSGKGSDLTSAAAVLARIDGLNG